MSGRAAKSLQAMREVVQNPDLRRLQLASAGSVLGNWGYIVALGVYAYDQGGPAAIGLVTVIRLVPSALAAPFVSILGDRFRRHRVMVMTDLARAALMTAAALAITVDGPAAAVYAIVGVSSLVGTGFRPAQAALLPSLARSPDELTAANVAASSVDGIGIFLGPALGGLLLAATSTEVVFLANALTFVWSALMVWRIRGGAGAAARPRKPSLFAEATAGFSTLAGERRARVLVSLYTAQTLIAGMLNMLLVVTALELLETGVSGVGFLTSALGVGSLAGGVVAVTLVGHRRLATAFGAGLALFGVPLAIVALWPDKYAAPAFIALIGVANTIVDVSAVTLMQRAVPDEVLSRVFGVMQSLLLGAMALGAVIGPALVEGLGIRAALAIAGLFLPATAILFARALARVDREAPDQAPEVALLQRIPVFAPLPLPAVEQLASSLTRVELPAGETVFRRGDGGDRYYVIQSGDVEIAPVDRPARTLGPGEGFGEIALLRDVPRTADAKAQTDVTLLALDRDDFIDVVTGNPQSTDAADQVIAANLGAVRAGMASA